ncbi:hypothetical protein VDGE_05848 [Verticillium dahliae]|uniref:Probable aspartic-type endopeptidase OPSB n=1 Tax=Verticillium dahliae TaxID=27337 RepID=A0A444RZ87_VERDA|nr:hypothetical protein VDGE_05848 [Verticillium dahliae]
MRTIPIWVLSSLLLSSTGEAVALRKRDGSPARVIGFDLESKIIQAPNDKNGMRRRNTVTASLDNLQTLYFVNATLGNPPQQFRLHLDTGSSDLWVNTANSQLCQEVPNPCALSGMYAANQSSSYNYLGSYFNISYVDGSGATGDYVTDDFNIGGTVLTDFQFGIGYESSAAQGILGVGYPMNEVQVGRAGMDPYDNIAAKMKAQGLIQSNAFSLYLNSLSASTGSILFGGVDTEHFVGELQTLPIQMHADIHSEFLVTLTDVTLGSTTMGSDLAIAVLLDSGSSLSYLPDAMVKEIYSMVGAVYQEEQAVAFVPCALRQSPANMTFTFSKPKITVPISELVLDLFKITGRQPTFSNGAPACLFGLAPAGAGTHVLGDTFMRSAYIVYDMENNEISLAQTRFNATRSNILEIGTGRSSVPSAITVAEPVAATHGLRGGGAAAAHSTAHVLTPLAGPFLAGVISGILGFVSFFI